jgi:DNA-3-methyladenine glycosylase II
MFCLQALICFPLGDVAVVNTIELLDIHEKEAMELHTKKWSPHRSICYFYCGIISKKEIGQ